MVRASVLSVRFFHLLDDRSDGLFVEVRSSHQGDGSADVIRVDCLEKGFQPADLRESFEHDRALEIHLVHRFPPRASYAVSRFLLRSWALDTGARHGRFPWNQDNTR